MPSPFQTINVGLVPNDKTGDYGRVGGIKINYNFEYIWENYAPLASPVFNGSISTTSALDVSLNATTSGFDKASYVGLGDVSGLGALVLLAGPAYSGFGGNSSLNLWNIRSGPIVFGTANAERMRITNSGNIGIGTLAPNNFGGGYTTLEVNNSTGGVFRSVGGSVTADFYADNAGTATIRTTTNHPLLLSTNNVERMRVSAAGDIAIGLTSANAKLNVAGTDGPLVFLANGATRGVRVIAGSFGSVIEGVDNTGVGSLQPLSLGGTAVYVNAPLLPNGDNTIPLGGASNRWSVVYSGTGAINTSDAVLKLVRGAHTDAELDAWGLVQAKVYQFIDAVAAKGEEHARLHAGYVAQEVEAAFSEAGIDVSRHALFCRDEITRRVKVAATREVQATDEVEEPYTEIEIRAGEPVQVTKTRMVPQPRVVMKPVRDAAGEIVMRKTVTVTEDGEIVVSEPVMHPVPVMITEPFDDWIDEPAGVRLGLRYDQCAVFEAAWTRRELARMSVLIAKISGK